jgi:hypothetical protein
MAIDFLFRLWVELVRWVIILSPAVPLAREGRRHGRSSLNVA